MLFVLVPGSLPPCSRVLVGCSFFAVSNVDQLGQQLSSVAANSTPTKKHVFGGGVISLSLVLNKPVLDI